MSLIQHFANTTPELIAKELLENTRKQAIEAIRTEITKKASKIEAATFDPKKGSWECNYCDYH